MIGKHAVEAATKLGNIERNAYYIENNGQGAVAFSVGRNLTKNHLVMEALLGQADILVDATQRRDPSLPVISNCWLACLPEHAIVVDLAVDPYLLDHVPPVVRGIEGIPQGNLDKYVFMPSDLEWDDLCCSSFWHRRITSRYSWPIHPARSFESLVPGWRY
jgi:alanine dehydrogenase